MEERKEVGVPVRVHRTPASGEEEEEEKEEE